MKVKPVFLRWVIVSFELVCVSTISIGAAHSAVLDQQDGSSPMVYPVDSSSQIIGQSFTVGVAGELDSIDLYLLNSTTGNGNVTLDIYNATTAGLPSSLLASSSNSLSALSIPTSGFYAFNFLPSDLTISVGEQLAFVLVPSSATFAVGATSSDTYSGGVSFKPSHAAIKLTLEVCFLRLT